MEYKTEWSAEKHLDFLQTEVEPKLKHIHFGTWQSYLTVSGTIRGNYRMPGQIMISVIVDEDNKEYFVHKLKTGKSLDDKFPHYIRAFILDNFDYRIT